jgi:hypothetical protein
MDLSIPCLLLFLLFLHPSLPPSLLLLLLPHPPRARRLWEWEESLAGRPLPPP